MKLFSTIVSSVLSVSILLMPIYVEAQKKRSGHSSTSSVRKKKHMKSTENYAANKPKKVIIWDLGGTLVKTDRFGMATHIGLGDIICYPLLDGKSPFALQDKVFDVLGSMQAIDAKNGQLGANSPDGRVLPAVMCDWLAGKEDGASLARRAHKQMHQLEQMNRFYFASSRERRLVENTIDVMFNPELLAQNTKVIKPAVRLLENCFRQTDGTGNHRHRMLVLSNWDSISFNNLQKSEIGTKVLKFFRPEDIIISGDMKLIKPDHAIFQRIIQTHKLNPHDCIFIDDQIENVKAARRAGMDGILLADGNYAQLKQQLVARGVF